jgi:septal ring factor EnvC (AmiA/AmiB activator)
MVIRFSKVVAIALSLTAMLGAQQSDRVRTEALARRATERMQALQREAEVLASEEKTLLGDLRKLDVERQLKSEAVRQLDGEAAEVERELNATNERLTKLQQQDMNARPDLAARLVEMYKRGQSRYLRLLLSTADARRIGEASRTVAVMAKLDRDRVATHQRTLGEVASTKTALEQRRRHLMTLGAEAERARVEVERATRAKNDLIHDIDRRRDLNAQLAGELQAVQQKLQVALRDVAAGASGVEPAALPLKPFRGALEWPVAGSLQRRFSPQASGRTPASNGIEIGAAEGAPVVAIHEGTVAFADRFAGFGNLVIIDHGSQTFSLYGNLLDIAVKKGARIDRSQPVGTVGTAATGPAGLYFELRVDGQVVDPLQWLKKR